VVFNFLDLNEAALVQDNPHSMDHDALLEISPFYFNYIRNHPNQPIDVPEEFCAKMVNAFIQMIWPAHAKSLPTHSLWRSELPVPGIYDRFGAIGCEKLTWSVDNLLELLAFARFMEVYSVCDIVIDRLHFMFLEQQKAHSIRSPDEPTGPYFKPEPASHQQDLDFTLSASAFRTPWLTSLCAQPIDTQTLTFIADLMHALPGTPDETWLSEAPDLVQSIFADAASSNSLRASRSTFCAQYHHHADLNAPCYTTFAEHTPQQYVHELYAVSSHAELVAGQQEADAAPGMLEAEKMVLEMEMRVEAAKGALGEARSAGAEEKEGWIRMAWGGWLGYEGVA
jgi:hypothetical protein